MQSGRRRTDSRPTTTSEIETAAVSQRLLTRSPRPSPQHVGERGVSNLRTKESHP